MFDYDVIVIGGGPAGTTSALKCSESGLTVLLVEKKGPSRHKPCGGILPKICVDVISESFELNVPQKILCSPATLGLYYVPPSGRVNSGNVKNYKLFNIHRDLFDIWLRQLATDSGVNVLYNTEFLAVQNLDPVRVLLRQEGHIFPVTCKYLIGADGVYSRVRSQLSKKFRSDFETISQEFWKATGDFGDYFYAFFRGEISSTYAYVIPKDNLFVLGIGIPQKNSSEIDSFMNLFKDWLEKEFAFSRETLIKKEAWAIPYGFTFTGIKNILLVGDSAGFCNALSGEGIRFAIESGLAASTAIQKARLTDIPLVEEYNKQVDWLSSFITDVYQFAVNLTDESREEFVSSQLNVALK